MVTAKSSKTVSLVLLRHKASSQSLNPEQLRRDSRELLQRAEDLCAYLNTSSGELKTTEMEVIHTLTDAISYRLYKLGSTQQAEAKGAKPRRKLASLPEAHPSRGRTAAR